MKTVEKKYGDKKLTEKAMSCDITNEDSDEDEDTDSDEEVGR